MFNKIFISFFILILFVSCTSSNRKISNSEENKVKTPEEIYLDAMIFYENENYLFAEEEFVKLSKLYPLSNEAVQGEIILAFIKYIQLDYDNAILKFKRIAKKYPSHNRLDYIYYMIAMCNYEQIASYQLDGQYNEIAYDAFNQVILRFPNSEYAKDSSQKIVLIKSNKAAKHMAIGRFYLKEKKFTAALNRFKIVVEDYSMTKFTPEALHRMVEAYYEMGMIEESSKMASTLGYNYPNSKWYKYSYNLIKKNDQKISTYKKITNFFN